MSDFTSSGPAVLGITLANDLDYSIRFLRWFLKSIGAWPKSGEISRTEKFLSEVLIFGCSVLIAVMLVPLTLSTFLDEDPRVRMRAIGPAVFWIMASLKYYLLLLHGDNIKRCIQHVEIDWKSLRRTEDRDIMLRNVKFARFLVGFCTFFMHTSVLTYNAVRASTTSVVLVGNDSVVLYTVPMPFYTGPIDSRVTPFYQIVFAIECFSTIVVNSVTVVACTTATVFVMHACGQLDILMSWLQGFVKQREKAQATLNEKLTTVVKHHLRVLSFIARIEEIMHQICLVEIIGCTMNICLLGYYFITEWERNETKTSLALSIIFTSISFNIFIFCYIGEILSEQCRLVGETAYMTDWYRLPRETALCFILIISRSSGVIKITAGKLIQLSIATFGDVIRTSLAYLNMLRTITA